MKTLIEALIAPTQLTAQFIFNSINWTFLLQLGAILIVPVLLLIGAYVWLAFSGAEHNTFATELGVDRYKFVGKGKSLYKVLHNLRNAYLDKNNKLTLVAAEGVETYKNPINQYLRDHFGIYFVSLFYPQRKLLQLEIRDIHRLNKSAPGVLANKVVVQAVPKETDEFYRYLDRPVYKEITLGKDGAPVDIVIMYECEAIDPVRAALSLNGDFFRRLDAGADSVVEDWANGMSFESLLTTPTGKGKTIAAFMNPSIVAIAASSGIEITDAYIQEMRPHGALATKAQDLAIAEIEAKVTATNATAEAGRITTLADANLIAAQKEATGKAAQFLEPIKVMIDPAIGVTADVAAQVVAREIALSRIAESKLTTFVEGGSTVKPAVALPVTPP